MTGVFKANNPYNNFLLFIYGLLLKLPAFIHPSVPLPQEMDGFLYRLMLRWLEPTGNSIPAIYPAISFILVYLQAISLNKIVNDQRLMQKPSYLTGMSYILITSLFPEWQSLSAPIMINTLLIWVLGQLCILPNNPKPKTVLFNIGLMTGFATFFYFPSIAFGILIIVGLYITRPFILPEWLIVTLGVLTPYYFFGSWLYLTDRWENYQLPAIQVVKPFFLQTTWSYIAIALISLNVIVGVYFIRANMLRQLVQTRKSWSLVFLYVIVAFFVPFINKNERFDYWVLVAVPVSIIAGAAFLYPEKKWFSLVVHWGMVGLTIIMGYFIR